MKSYKEVRREIADDVEASAKLPCTYCKTPTEPETLRNLGAMCRPCFNHYCGDAFNDEDHKARYMAGLRSRVA